MARPRAPPRVLASPGLSGMIAGMTKIAVSLPDRLVVGAKRAVAQGRAESVSAYVALALEEREKADDLADLLREMLDETGGPLTHAERQTADRSLEATSKRRARSA
jgi:hypothetical protein